MADRKIIISQDGMSYKTEGNLSIPPGFNVHERVEKYGNHLVNGQVEVTSHDGSVTIYGDGCHLIEHETGHLVTMSKDQYVKWNGRAGSENEDLLVVRFANTLHHVVRYHLRILWMRG